MTDTHEVEITCPYNEAHRILQGRMATHLQRCRKQYDKEFGNTCPKEKCPFDSNHRVNAVELDYHIKFDCAKRAQFAANCLSSKPNNPVMKSEKPVAAHELAEYVMQSSQQNYAPSECWDDDDDYSSLDQAFVNKAAVLRQTALQKPIYSVLNCEQPLDRKSFQAQRKKIFRSQNTKGSESEHPVKGYQPPILSSAQSASENKPDEDGFIEVKRKVRAPSNASLSMSLGIGAKVPSKNKKIQPKPAE